MSKHLVLEDPDEYIKQLNIEHGRPSSYRWYKMKTVCGHLVYACYACTTNLEEVTCRSCMKTNAYKDQMRNEYQSKSEQEFHSLIEPEPTEPLFIEPLEEEEE